MKESFSDYLKIIAMKAIFSVLKQNYNFLVPFFSKIKDN